MHHKQNCIYFLSDRPCKFHKKNVLVTCDNCKFYYPISKKILIIKLAAIGDVLRTTSILKPIFRKYKSPRIFWITYDDALDVLKNNPYIYEVIPFSKSFNIFNQNFDILINLDLDSSALSLTKQINATEKVGFYLNSEDEIVCSNNAAEYWFDLSHNDILKKKNKRTYQECMLEILGIQNLKLNDYPIILQLTQQEKEFAKSFYKQQIGRQNKKFLLIGLNLGGGDKWQKKEYPVSSTIKLIKYILKNEKKLGKEIKILLFGGKKEKQRNQQIVSSLQNYVVDKKLIDTGCDNSLREFFALVNLCDILITSDTLALHVAVGLRKKVLALFGPTSSSEIELYKLGKKIITPLDCYSCYRRVCNKKPDCMESISPQNIFKELRKII